MSELNAETADIRCEHGRPDHVRCSECTGDPIIVREFCDYVEGPTQARCHKEPGHDGPHNGWAHFPGQLVTWDYPLSRPASTTAPTQPTSAQVAGRGEGATS